MPGEERGRRERLAVRPDRVGLDPVAYAKRAVRRVALVRAVRLLLARLEQVVPQVLLRHVVHRQVPGLVEELRAERVEDRLPREEAAEPVRDRLEEQDGARRRVGDEVELPRGSRPERPAA